MPHAVPSRSAAADRPAHSVIPGPGLPPLTLLLVEDSRFAAEGIRILCRKMGIRLRRAQSLAEARAHLRVYRPDIALVDIGMPDGSGLDLIASLHQQHNRPSRIIATSGEPTLADSCLAAGAQAFVGKPCAVADLVAGLLGADAGAFLPPPCAADPWQSAFPSRFDLGGDPLALSDDLRLASDLLNGARDPDRLRYAAQFLQSIARLLDDTDLGQQLVEAAINLDRQRLRDTIRRFERPSVLL